MNAQRAYEYLNKSSILQSVTDFHKGLIEALTGEKEKVKKPVKVGDRVRFSQDGVGGVGEVCYVYENGTIHVGFDTQINGSGWAWRQYDTGYDHAKKRGFKYRWSVSKDHYTIIGRA